VVCGESVFHPTRSTQMTDDARREEQREPDDRMGSQVPDDHERPERDRTQPRATRDGLTDRERRERWPVG